MIHPGVLLVVSWCMCVCRTEFGAKGVLMLHELVWLWWAVSLVIAAAAHYMTLKAAR